MYLDDVIWWANQVMNQVVPAMLDFKQKAQKIKWAAKSIEKNYSILHDLFALWLIRHL